jgi:signal transduction histidine kinase
LSAGPSFARVAVEDGGPGVAAADLPHLFERYYQGAGPARGGSGLGLSVARWVVEQHGGAIAALSEAGRGLVVEFRLPLAA